MKVVENTEYKKVKYINKPMLDTQKNANESSSKSKNANNWNTQKKVVSRELKQDNVSS